MAIKTYKKGDSAKLSDNFRVSEFLCHGSGCCSSGKVDEKLVQILQKIRDHFGKPVHISSAYRCPTWNQAVGGVSGSYHLHGQAADIKVEDTAPAEVAKYAESIGVLGIGLYETDSDGYFVHVDTRTAKSFWYGQKQERRTTFGGGSEEPRQTAGCTLSFPYLREGSTGETVRSLQQLLTAKGCPCGDDGIFGPKTRKAVEQYQQAQGLGVDGIVGEKTMSRLWGL